MRAAGRYDLVWLEKEFLPWCPGLMEHAALARTPYVVDFDDAWFLRYQAHPRSLVRRLLGDKFDRTVCGAACVVAGNAVLADWARDRGARRVVRVPTVVDDTRYLVTPLPEEPFTVGWIGTPMTAPSLSLVHEALRQLARQGPIRLRVIGAPGLTLDGVTVESLPWSEATEAAQISSFHVGIMPLADAPWERGKCGYKLIQYMAAGRPVVASPVGANTEIVLPGETGFLARTPTEWIDALETVRSNPGQGYRMGLAARHRVETHYSLASQVDPLTSLFADIAKTARR